jgi:hypothetical protein
VAGPFFTLERLWPETVEPLDEEDSDSDSVSVFLLLDLDFFLLFRERPFFRRLCSEELSELELELGLLLLLLCLLRLLWPLRDPETSTAEAERRMLVPRSGRSNWALRVLWMLFRSSSSESGSRLLRWNGTGL